MNMLIDEMDFDKKFVWDWFNKSDWMMPFQGGFSMWPAAMGGAPKAAGMGPFQGDTNEWTAI